MPSPSRPATASAAGYRRLAGDLRNPVLQLQGLLIVAVALGGGGVGYGLRNLAIQLFAIAVLANNPALVARFMREAPRMLVLLVACSIALPLVQLVPLPPSIWQGLPERDLVIRSLALAGGAQELWYPLSLDRARTLVAFCGTLAPACIIVIGCALPTVEKLRLCRTLVVAALAAFLLGAAQLASANSFGILFPIEANTDVFYATFANRNSTGLFFALGALLCAVLASDSKRALLPAVGAGAFLALGTVLTQSRSSMALLSVVILFAAIVAISMASGTRAKSRAAKSGTRWVAAVALAVFALVMAAGAVSFMNGGRVATSAQRLVDTTTDRPEVWEDGIYAARQLWPAGSGMGTFDEVFQLYESLEYVSPKRAGRAHQDYIELAMEAGPAGLLILAGWLGWICWTTLRQFPTTRRWIALGAGSGLGMIALQSLLDYPLRNQTLLCVAALMVVLLARHREDAA